MSFDPYHRWLGIPPKHQPPNYYRLLGIEIFEDDAEVIDAAANQRMGYVQQRASGDHAADAQKILGEISKARLCLLHSAKKSAYDDRLQSQAGTELNSPPEPTHPFIDRGSAPSSGSSLSFNAYHRWLGIPLKHQPPNHYRLLGIEIFESDAEVITDAAMRQMGHVRLYQSSEHAALAERILNELETARACLVDAARKEEYDGRLRMQAVASEAPASEAAALDRPFLPPSVSSESAMGSSINSLGSSVSRSAADSQIVSPPGVGSSVSRRQEPTGIPGARRRPPPPAAETGQAVPQRSMKGNSKRPLETASFCRVLRKSKLLDEEQLEQVAMVGGTEKDPIALAWLLVKGKLITRWQAEQLLAGRYKFTLGKYTLLKKIGAGGVGAVFKAQQSGMDRVVALKILNRKSSQKQSSLARFQREVEAASRLNHPNVVRALDAGELEGVTFL
ncbi:MAG: protein kinase, partial [Planctomycetales bacterium]